MKTFAIVAVLVLCASLTEAKHRARRSQQSALNLLLRDAAADAAAPAQTATAQEHACDIITEEEKQHISKMEPEMKEAVEEFFRELAAVANMIPRPPPFVCDDRMSRVGGFLHNFGEIGKSDTGKKFVEWLAAGMMHLAEIALYDPKKARDITTIVVQEIEKKKAKWEENEKANENPTRAFQRRQTTKYSKDEFTEGIVKEFCDRGKAGQKVQNDIHEVIEDGIQMVHYGTSINRAIRVVATAGNDAVKMLQFFEFIVNGLAYLEKTDPDQAKRVMDFVMTLEEEAESPNDGAGQGGDAGQGDGAVQQTSSSGKRILNNKAAESFVNTLRRILEESTRKRK